MINKKCGNKFISNRHFNRLAHLQDLPHLQNLHHQIHLLHRLMDFAPSIFCMLLRQNSNRLHALNLLHSRSRHQKNRWSHELLDQNQLNLHPKLLVSCWGTQSYQVKLQQLFHRLVFGVLLFDLALGLRYRLNPVYVCCRMGSYSF